MTLNKIKAVWHVMMVDTTPGKLQVHKSVSSHDAVTLWHEYIQTEENLNKIARTDPTTCLVPGYDEKDVENLAKKYDCKYEQCNEWLHTCKYSVMRVIASVLYNGIVKWRQWLACRFHKPRHLAPSFDHDDWPQTKWFCRSWLCSVCVQCK